MRVSTQPVTVPGKGRSRNVIGVRPGRGRCLRVVMAHADTVAGSPGANDNASGLGALAELAERTRRGGLPCELWLVATGAEERIFTGARDHLGALALARLVRRNRGAARLRWALSLDEVGRSRSLALRSPAAGQRGGVERAMADGGPARARWSALAARHLRRAVRPPRVPPAGAAGDEAGLQRVLLPPVLRHRGQAGPGGAGPARARGGPGARGTLSAGYRQGVTARQRIAWFGFTALLIAAGIGVGALGQSITAEAIGIFLVLVGFLGVVMLVFLEVGLSEDHDRERDEARRAERAAAPPRHPPQRLRLPRRPRRPG